MNGQSMHDASHLFIITGGPGAGKTTLVEALRAAGYTCSDEAGRQIIKEEVAAGGTALPWIDPRTFADRMLAFDIESYQRLRMQKGPVFFDRGIPDVIGYLNLLGLCAPEPARQAAANYSYNPRVFIAPPWQEIFGQDSERKQTFEEAERTYGSLAKVYATLGYELIALPIASVEARVAFVIEAARNAMRASPPGS
jgi:predicted ATPase